MARAAMPAGVDQSTAPIDALVARIVNAVHPLRIILFGSAARGEMHAESDVDVMVVMPDGAHCRRTAMDIRQHLFGLSYPVDIVVATPSILEKHKDNIGLMYQTALEEGKDIYVAPRSAAR